MSCMRKHPKKTLRNITFMTCLSSKSSSPSRVLWEGIAWGHATHHCPHTLQCCLNSSPTKRYFYSQPGHLDLVFRSSLSSSPCLPSFNNLETSAKIPAPGESSSEIPKFQQHNCLSQKNKKKKKLRYKFALGCLSKRKTGKMVFPQGAYAAVPGARTQLL